MLSLTDIYKRFSLHAGYFTAEREYVYAVNGLNLRIERGEIYGLVGESGSGKTTVARMIVRMFPASKGNISYLSQDGKEYDLSRLKRSDLRAFRSLVRYVFQDPARSLDSRMTVEHILYSGFRYAPQWTNYKDAREVAALSLARVGLDASMLGRHPTNFSGGQRQRIAIARALITQPELLICDEIVSALDSPIRRKILDLILSLRNQYHLSVLFISHDLATISYVSDRIGVMYKGRLVEEGRVHDIVANPLHPYTQRLYHAVPRLNTPPQVISANNIAHMEAEYKNKYEIIMREVEPGHLVAS